MAIFNGTAANNTLTGNVTDDVLNGLAGNDDQLNAREGDDVLDGGAGNDWLSGGSGDDTYLFGAGSGKDTINEYSYSNNYGGNDTVVFNGLTKSDVSFAKAYDGTGLVVTVKATGETLAIQGGFKGDESGFWVETFKFTDATLSQADINVLTSSGGAGDDTIWGFIGKDTLTGGAGNDLLSGAAAMTPTCSAWDRVRIPSTSTTTATTTAAATKWCSQA